jgi:hypothetical protein
MITRADLSGEIGQDAALLAIWVKLNQWATWKPYVCRFAGRTFALERGQLVTTERAILGALHLRSRSVVRRCLAALARLGRITVEALADATLVTVLPVAAASDRTQNHPTTAEGHGPQGIPALTDDDKTADETGYKTGEVDATKQFSPPPQVARAYEPENGVGGNRVQLEEPPEPPTTPEAAVAGLPSGDDAGPCHGVLVPDKPAPTTTPAAAAAPPSSGLNPEEADLLRYAQRRLARIVSPGEAATFVETLRASPWLTPPLVREAVDWIAAHPRARSETKSINRVFHLERVKRDHRRWDEAVRHNVGVELAHGATVAEAAERVARQAPSCEPEVMRAFALRLAGEVAAAGLRQGDATG